VNIGLRLGPEVFPQYLQKFGLGQVTGVDLPGEAKGIVINQSAIKAINLATMAMGQGIAVTPLQLLTAVAGVVNCGQLLRPQIVREIRDEAGTLLRPFAADLQRQVIEPAVSRQLNEILEQVVQRGTGKNAGVEGFRIGGKTGTAQKAGPGGYLPGKYVASFAGFWPTENPRIAALVVIDEPVGLYYGGQIAAPVFQAMMIDILQYYTVQGAKQK
jgi:stage V sporulation protein D (sporulation-specific penicillin-binding protein)